MKNKHPDYMTTPKERVSYWTFFVGQNIYYNITAMFISTYLAMQGISLAKVGTVLLIVKVWDAVNDPIFGFIFDRIKFKNGQKSLPWLRLAAALFPIVTVALFSIPSALSDTGKLWWFGIGMMISTVFYLFYKLNDRDVQIMASCNAGQISRAEAEARLSRKY